MKLFLRRRDTDALLDGRGVEADSGLGDVESFLADMRREFATTSAPAPRPTLAATLDGRRPLRPASEPLPPVTFPDRRPRAHLRLRPVAAVFATAAVLFSGLATAGALPASMQRPTAQLASHVGLHLPGGPAASSGSRGDVQPGSSPSQSHRGSTNTAPATGATTPPTVVPAGPDVPDVVPPAPVLPTPAPTVPTATPTLPVPTLPLPPPTIFGLGRLVPNLPTTPGWLFSTLGSRVPPTGQVP